MHQTVAIRMLRKKRLADVRRRAQAFCKPVAINRDRLVMLQDFHPNGRGRVIQADGKKAAFVVKDHGKITRLTVVALLVDGLIEQPGMPNSQRTFCCGRDAQGNAPRRRLGELSFQTLTPRPF